MTERVARMTLLISICTCNFEIDRGIVKLLNEVPSLLGPLLFISDNIALMFIFLQGLLTDVQVPCHVAGMKHPVYLALASNVNGLTVSYKTPRPTSANNR